MSHRARLLDKLALSSLRLNKGLALLLGLAMLLIGFSYWSVHRILKEQRNTVEFHFARLMENIQEHEAFLNTVYRRSGNIHVPTAPHPPQFVIDEGNRTFVVRESTFSLPFSVKINPATISEVDHAKIDALGAHLANYFSAFWSASHYKSPQVFVFDVPDNFEVSVPAAGRLRGVSPMQNGELARVMRRVVEPSYDNRLEDVNERVHWLKSPRPSDGSDATNIVGYVNIDLASTPVDIFGISPRVVVASLLNLSQANDLKRIMKMSAYDYFSLISPTGEAVVGTFKSHVVLDEGLNLTRDGLVFRVKSPGDQYWTGIYVISLQSFLDYAMLPLLGLISLMPAGLGCGWAFNRWYKNHVVLPAHQAHKDITGSEAFSRAVIDTAPTGLCVVRCNDHQVLLENQRAQKSNYTTRLIAALDQQHGIADLGHTELEVDGRHLHVGFVLTRYNGHDAWLCAFHDVTRHIEVAVALEDARQAAEAANEAKTRFLATMSHEIRTPLYGVLGTLELLGLTNLAPRQQEYLHTIQRSSATLFQLISDVLDVSKIESGQMTIDAVEFCPLEMTEVTLHTYSAFAHAKSLQLYACIDATLPERVRGDPLRIRQILNNLLSNAIKFTESGRVVLRVRVVERNTEYSSVEWQVSDSGMGISKDQQLKLFDPFYQAGDAASVGGAGLGLSICRRLCDLMAGQLNVVSEPGLGSSFTLQLKLAREPGTLLDCATFEAPAPQVYVRSPVPELTQHTCAWLLRMGVDARPLTNDRLTITHSTPLLEMLASDNLADWTGPRIIAKSGGRNPPEYGAEGWEVDAHNIRAIGWAISFALHGQNTPDNPLLLKKNMRINQRILVAEDNPINQAIVKEQLEALGCSVVVASNGEQALAQWLPGLFDLVLTDVNMPIINGYELAKALREHDPFLPIIGITANAMHDEGERCAAVGMNAWMVKPLNLHTLRTQLLKHCKVSAAPLATGTGETIARGNSEDQIQLSPRMRELFIKTMYVDLKVTRAALESADTCALKSLLHRMAGALGAVQASDLATACAELEYRLGGLNFTPGLARDIPMILERIESLLQKLTFWDE